MPPVLIDASPWLTQGHLMALGAVVGAALTAWLAPRPARAVIILIASALAALCGARALWWIVMGQGDPHLLIDTTSRAGLTSLGALVSALVAIVALTRALYPPHDRARARDALSASILTALAFARAGCALRGCDFGRPAPSGWWAGSIAYGHEQAPAWLTYRQLGGLDAAGYTPALIPWTLYLSAATLASVAIGWRLGRPDSSRAEISRRAPTMIALYAIARLVLEGGRHPLAAPRLSGWSINQILVFIALLAAAVFWGARRVAARSFEPSEKRCDTDGL